MLEQAVLSMQFCIPYIKTLGTYDTVDGCGYSLIAFDKRVTF